MNEKILWAKLRQGMKDKWHATRHEDILSEGVPDVSYGLDGTNGWIELKCVDKKPVRGNKKVRVKSLTSAQVAWITARGKAGGSCWILLAVGSTVFLLSWRTARAVKQGLSMSDLSLLSAYQTSGPIDWSELHKVLIKGH